MIKKYALVLAIGLAAVGGWWRFNSPRDAAATTQVASAVQAARQSASGNSTAPENHAKSGATDKINPTSAVFGKMVATEGEPLDDKARAQSQLTGRRPLGRTATFDTSAVALRELQRGQVVSIPLPGRGEVKGIVNLVQPAPDGTVRIGGSLADNQGSFSLAQTPEGLAGRVLVRSQELAYVMIPSSHVRSQLTESVLSAVICFPFKKDAAAREPQSAARPPRQASAPELRSRPGAGAVLYLVFDGATVTDPDWNDGNPINAAASTLNAAEITEVWNRVKEDYAPFNINVTTVASDYAAAAVNRRSRVIITPTDSWYPDAGGVAYNESFAGKTLYAFSSEIPAWVFNTSVNGIAEAISHELGHTLGLDHDGRTSPLEEYYQGHGSGATSWAPIMGTGYYVNVIQWSKGEYPNANNHEDDVAIIAGLTSTTYAAAHGHPLFNNTGYITDEAGDSRGAAASLGLLNSSFNQSGVISSAVDSDFYSFTLASTNTVTINADPPSVYSKQANLDVLLELQDSSGAVLATANPDGGLNASITQALPAGTYYLKVAGAGRTGSGADFGYTHYGSVGQYSLTGSVSVGSPPSITGQDGGVTSGTPGNYVAINVYATGAPTLAYQWQRLRGAGIWMNLTDDLIYSGTHTSRIVVLLLSLMDGDQYRCLVSNPIGSVTSTPMTFTMAQGNALGWISMNFPSGGVQGAQVSGTATVVNAGSVTWTSNDRLVLLSPGDVEMGSASLSGVAPGQATTVTISFAAPYQLVSTSYSLRPENPGVPFFSASRSFSFTVSAPATAPNIITQPQGQAANLGDNVTLNVLAIGQMPLAYQWKLNGNDIISATSATLALNNIQVGSAGDYRVVVTNGLGTATSDVAVVSIGVPPGVVSVSGGDENTVFVRANGARWGTGYTGGGELGVNSYSLSQPVQIDTGVAQAKSRGEMGAYVKLDGTLWLMGHNINAFVQGGQVYQTAPLAMTGATSVATMALGSSVSYVRSDGTLWTAGNNSTGQLGDGTTTNRYTPAPIAQDVTAVAAGTLHTIFLKGDGTVWGCGYNTSGQLGIGVYGDGQSSANTTPYLIAQGVAAIDARGNYNLLLKADGSLWLLGAPPWLFGTTLNAQIATNVVRMSAGGTHCLFVKADGTLWAMGKNDYGQLGDGTLNDRTSPVQVATGVFDVAGGSQHSLFIKNDGSLWGMGKSFSYQLGSNTGNGKLSTPIQLATGIVALSSVPTGVSASDGTAAGAVRISWSHAAGAAGYEIWRATGNNSGSATKVGTVYGRSVFYDTTATAGTAYYYWVKALNSFGVSGFSSPDAGLAASPTLPVISLQPVSVIYPRGSALPVFTVAASGNPSPTYRWQAKAAAASTWFDISTGSSIFAGTLTPQLSVLSMWEPYDGIQLRCVVTNSAGSVMSNAATWAFVNGPNAPVISAHPVAVSTTVGSTVTFTAAASGPAWYQWQRRPAGGDWFNIDGSQIFVPGVGWTPSPYSDVSTGTLTVTGVTAGMNGEQYRFMATNYDGSVFSNAAALTVISTKTWADLNGDGKADLLWRNSGTNEHAGWLMNGTIAAGTASYGMPAEWRVIKAADFDGDGKSDLVWRNNATGAVVLWQMNGTIIGTSTWIYDSGTDWTAEVFADFNGDGKTDILWHNTVNGQYAIWLMNGGTVSSASGFSIAAGWSVAKAADFNGDGKTDLLWRNASTGGVVMWLQNGTTTTSTTWIYDSGTDWALQLFADFNGDGKTDILWHNTVTGQYAFWLMNGATVSSASGFSIAVGWSVTHAADFSGDGKADLIWRNSTSGGMVMWLQNGTTTTSTAWIYDSGTDWTIAATKDFNGDGKVDILWRNTITGEYAFWLMNGATTSSASGFSLPAGWELTE